MGGKIIALGTSQELKDSVYDTQVMEVKAKNITFDVIERLKEMYSEVRSIENGVEIVDRELSFDEIVDYLPFSGSFYLLCISKTANFGRCFS